jgi:PAS domain S-box-containing protein
LLARTSLVQAATLSPSGSGSAAQRIIKIGVYDNSPKVFRNDRGVAAGLFPDILNYIAQQENWKVEYVFGTWEEGLARLEKGSINIMPDVAISETRQQQFDFTNQTVMSSWGIVFVQKNSTITSFHDLDGKTIAILPSSVYMEGTEGIEQYVHAFGLQVKFVTVPEYQDVFALLNKGEVDAAVVSRIFALTNYQRYPHIKETDIFFKPTELRFALTKGNPDNLYLTERLDYWIKKLRDGHEGVYTAILTRYGLHGMIVSREVAPTWLPWAVVGGGGFAVIMVFIVVRLWQKWTVSIQQLRESEEKFSQVFQTSPHAISITEVAVGRFLDINDTFLSLTGYTRDEVVGSSSEKLSLWANPADRQQVVTDLQAGRPIQNREYLFRAKNGTTRVGLYSAHMMKLGTGTYILSSIADINNLKLAEAKIVELVKRDEAILDSIGDAVFACDKDGRILAFNKMAEKLSGVTAQQAIGQHFSRSVTFVREKSQKASNDFITQAMTQKKITKMASHIALLNKDGRSISVADSAAPVRDAQGNIIGCVVVFRDVTEERKIDKAKTEFVSLASHQLRTPLTALRWITESLLSENAESLNHKQKQQVTELSLATQRIIDLVNSLLNASRLELGTFKIEPQLVSWREAVAVCRQELSVQLAVKKIDWQEQYDNDVTTITADPKLLHIVLENLLSNAVKYSLPNGRIALTVRREPHRWLLTVSDHGMGIPLAAQSKIFTRMFRADNAVLLDPDGTGLGLYLVKEIVDHAGGKIWFTSTEGQGSSFYVQLPLAGMTEKKGEKELI